MASVVARIARPQIAATNTASGNEEIEPIAPVKLYKSHKVGGPGSHAEHKSRADSEYCPLGMYFRKATDGREPRESEAPVQ